VLSWKKEETFYARSRVARQARLRLPIARPPIASRLLLAPLPRHRGDFASGGASRQYDSYDSSITSDGYPEASGWSSTSMSLGFLGVNNNKNRHFRDTNSTDRTHKALTIAPL